MVRVYLKNNVIKKLARSPPLPTFSMHMLPKSHKSGFYKHDSGTEFHIGYGMVDRPKPEEVPVHVHAHVQVHVHA